MSDSVQSPRPVSLVTIAVIFLGLSLFILIARQVYHTGLVSNPDNQTAENLPKDLAWRATPESRLEHLKDLQKKQAEQAVAYAWVTKPTDAAHPGVVQLPISRAMELIVQQYGTRK